MIGKRSNQWHSNKNGDGNAKKNNENKPYPLNIPAICIYSLRQTPKDLIIRSKWRLKQRRMGLHKTYHLKNQIPTKSRNPQIPTKQSPPTFALVCIKNDPTKHRSKTMKHLTLTTQFLRRNSTVSYQGTHFRQKWHAKKTFSFKKPRNID